jgi:hypothetical protein
MNEPSVEFARHIEVIVTRYLGQHDRSPPEPAELQRIAQRLWSLILQRGLPPPLLQGDAGTAGGIPEAECTRLLRQVMDGADDPLLIDVLRQIIKACFHPEFTVCRDSYRAVSADGECRRQQSQRARNRVSGAHCVDCPYWVALDRSGHEALLRAAWRGDASVFDTNVEIFLPEDFRAFRKWLHTRVRQP